MDVQAGMATSSICSSPVLDHIEEPDILAGAKESCKTVATNADSVTATPPNATNNTPFAKTAKPYERKTRWSMASVVPLLSTNSSLGEKEVGAKTRCSHEDLTGEAYFEQLTGEVSARSNYADLEDRDGAAVLSVMDWLNYQLECIVAADKHMRLYILLFISMVGMLIQASIWASVNHSSVIEEATASSYGDALWTTFLVLYTADINTDVGRRCCTQDPY